MCEVGEILKCVALNDNCMMGEYILIVQLEDCTWIQVNKTEVNIRKNNSKVK